MCLIENAQLLSNLFPEQVQLNETDKTNHTGWNNQQGNVSALAEKVGDRERKGRPEV